MATGSTIFRPFLGPAAKLANKTQAATVMCKSRWWVNELT